MKKLYLMELTAENMLYGLSYYCDSEASEIIEGFERYNRQRVLMLAKKFFTLNEIVPNHHNMFRFEQTLRTRVPHSVASEDAVLDFIDRKSVV